MATMARGEHLYFILVRNLGRRFFLYEDQRAAFFSVLKNGLPTTENTEVDIGTILSEVVLLLRGQRHRP